MAEKQKAISISVIASQDIPAIAAVEARRRLTDELKKRGMISDSRKPYVHEHREPESSTKVVTILNDFYRDKAQFDALQRTPDSGAAVKQPPDDRPAEDQFYGDLPTENFHLISSCPCRAYLNTSNGIVKRFAFANPCCRRYRF